MYSLSVARDFIAQHFLIGGDWGHENIKHSHNFKVEVLFFGETLDQHGYLIDICDVNEKLDHLTKKYADSTLNDFDEFKGLNPSIENFSRIYLDSFLQRLSLPNIQKVEVKIWEDGFAWASCARLL